MYVCICKNITDRDIKQSISEGVTNLDDLRQSLGVASCCGRCATTAEEIISQHLQPKLGPGLFDLPYAAI